jgi:hypothetical protein
LRWLVGADAVDDTPIGLIELFSVFGLALVSLGYELSSVRCTMREVARKADVDRQPPATDKAPPR